MKIVFALNLVIKATKMLYERLAYQKKSEDLTIFTFYVFSTCS